MPRFSGFVLRGGLVCFVLSLSGCGSNKETHTSTQGTDQPSVSQSPTEQKSAGRKNSDRPQVTDPKFDYLTVIREFGGTDTAVLFAILPDQGEFKITEVRGPSFLGSGRSGKIDSEVMNHLFLKSSVPMSADERASITSKYFGAAAIYFEHYDGKLCRGPDNEYRVTITGSLGDIQVTTTFQFAAIPSATGDCQFHILNGLSSYQH